jgi:hypothetical protein
VTGRTFALEMFLFTLLIVGVFLNMGYANVEFLSYNYVLVIVGAVFIFLAGYWLGRTKEKEIL